MDRAEAALAATIRPPFEPRANAATARSISPASRTSIGLTSCRATAPRPGSRPTVRSRRIRPDPAGPPHARHARRDLLEQLQPFPAQAVFELRKPVALPPGRARLSTSRRRPDRRCARTRSARCGSPAAVAANVAAAAAPDTTSGASATNSAAYLRRSGGIASAPADVDPHIAADGPAQLLQPLQERRHAGLRFRHRRRAACMSTPMRRTRSPCCARAASGQDAGRRAAEQP